MSPPRVEWLDETELSTWRRYQAMSTVLDASLERQLQRDAGIPHSYYTILAILDRCAGRACRITALADATFTSQSRMSHAIAALEKCGWVRRERCSDDSRGNLAILTPEGVGLLKSAAPAHVRQVRQDVFDRLTREQVVQLGEICEALLQGMDPDRLAALDP